MPQAQRHYTLDEYLAVEAMSDVRYEYYDGEILALPGGSANHNRITKNLSRALDSAADRGCESYINDLRVKTASELYTYPDVFVVCGPLTYAADRQSVTNPVVIAEVLSTSTRDYDRGQKFDLYRTIATLRDYLLVDQYGVEVEHRFRDGDRWESRRYASHNDVIQLTGVDLLLRVDDLYLRVDFSSPATS